MTYATLLVAGQSHCCFRNVHSSVHLIHWSEQNQAYSNVRNVDGFQVTEASTLAKLRLHQSTKRANVQTRLSMTYSTRFLG